MSTNPLRNSIQRYLTSQTEEQDASEQVKPDPFRASVQRYVAEKETEVQQALEPQEDPSLARQALGLPVEAVKKGLTVLEAPVKYVGRPAAGWVAQETGIRPRVRLLDHAKLFSPLAPVAQAGKSPQEIAQSLRDYFAGFKVPEEQRENVENAESYTEAYRAATRDLSGLEKFGVDIAIDPLNVVGMGAGSAGVQALRGGARAIPVAGRAAPQLGRVARAFQPETRLGRAADAVADADRFIGDALALPLTGPIAVARGIGRRAGFHRGPGGFLRPSQGMESREAGRQAYSLTEDMFFSDRVQRVTNDRLRQLESSLFERAESGILDLSQTGAVQITSGQANLFDVAQIIDRDPEAATRLLQNADVRNTLVDAHILNTDFELTNYGYAHSRLNNALLSIGATGENLGNPHRTLTFLNDALPDVASTWKNTKFRNRGDFYQNLRIVSDDALPTQFTMNRDEGVFVLNVGQDANLYTLNREMLGGIFTELGGTIQDQVTLTRSMELEPNGLTRELLGDAIIDFFRTTEFGDPRLNEYALTLTRHLQGTPLSGAPSLGQKGKELVTARFSDAYFQQPADASTIFRMKRYDAQTDAPVPGWGEAGFPQTRQQLMQRQGFVVGQQQEARRAAQEAAERGQGPPEFGPRQFTRIEIPERLEPVDVNRWLSTLADDDPFETYFARVLELNNLSADDGERVLRYMQPYIDANPSYFQAGFILENHRFQGNLVKAMKNPGDERIYVSAALDALNLEREAYHLRSPVFGFLSRRIANAGRQFSLPHESGRFGQITDTMLREERDTVQQMLAPENELVHEFLGEWERNARIVDDAVQRIRYDMPVSGLTESTTFEQLFTNDRILRLFSDEEIRALEGALQFTGGIQGSRYRIQRFREELADRWMDDFGINRGFTDRNDVVKRRAKRERIEQGLEDLRPEGIKGHFEWATSAWREQALASVRYHVTNGLDMQVRGMLNGVAMSSVQKEGGAFEMAQLWGMDSFPNSLRDAIVRNTSMVTQAQTSEAPVRLANYANWLGMTRVGNALRVGVSKNRDLAMWMETSARGAAWKTHTENTLLRANPRYLSQMARELSNSGVAPDAIRDIVQSMGGHVRYGPQHIYDTLIRKGVDQTVAADQARRWQALIREASKEGERFALNVHLDFASETVLEEKLLIRHILPFHIWATRNIPFYLQTMAQNPWIVRVHRRWNEASEAEQNELGLTARFKEKMMLPDLGPANGILSFFLGPGYHAYNPMVSFSIFDQLRDPYIPEDQGGISFIGRGLAQAQRLGFSPAPWIDLPLNASGAYGTREPFGVWRQGDVITGTIDAVQHEAAQHLGTPTVNTQDFRPTVRLVHAIRNALPWVQEVHTITGSPRTDRAINFKIREMALEETGDGQNPLYTYAMTNPDSEIYQRASRDVRQQLWRDTLEGFIHPLPDATASEAEVATRRTAPRVEFGTMPDHVISYLSSVGHPSTQLWRAPDDVRRAEVNAGWAVLMDESVPYEQRWHIINQLGLRWFQEYYAWRNAQPEGADVSTDRWIEISR